MGTGDEVKPVAPKGAEAVNPYDDLRPKTEQVKEMFDSIAPSYDFMNRAMTFGIDKLWRRRAVRMVARTKPFRILDIATGTGDLAIKLARNTTADEVIGVDLSEKMLEVGRKKVERTGLTHCVSFRQADCLVLPFEDASFDCITVAYGVRNFANILDGYKEMYRVLRPGGTLCVVELSTPRGRFVKPLYDFYTRRMIPWLGQIVSKDVRAYSYLPESIAAVAQGDEMLGLMARAGFTDTRCRRMTFGTCSIYTGLKKE